MVEAYKSLASAALGSLYNEVLVIDKEETFMASLYSFNQFDWNIFIDYCNTPCYRYKVNDVVVTLD